MGRGKKATSEKKGTKRAKSDSKGNTRTKTGKTMTVSEVKRNRGHYPKETLSRKGGKKNRGITSRGERRKATVIGGGVIIGIGYIRILVREKKTKKRKRTSKRRNGPGGGRGRDDARIRERERKILSRNNGKTMQQIAKG